MVLHKSLSDRKSPEVSRTPPSILADLNSAVVSARTSISKSYSLFTKPLGIIQSAPITIGIIVTFIFPSLFSSLGRSKYLFLCSFSLIFTHWSTGTANFTVR